MDDRIDGKLAVIEAALRLSNRCKSLDSQDRGSDDGGKHNCSKGRPETDQIADLNEHGDLGYRNTDKKEGQEKFQSGSAFVKNVMNKA